MIWAIINLLMVIMTAVYAIVSAVAGDWAWVALFMLLAAVNMWAVITNPEVRRER